MRQRDMVAALSALLVLFMTACHGRPLQSQMAHARPSPADTTGSAVATGNSPTSAPRLDDLLARQGESRSKDGPIAREHLDKVTEAVRLRDPRRSKPRHPVSWVRARMNHDLANAARPSWRDPAKAFMPGEVGVDVPAFFAFLKCAELFRRKRR